MQEFQELTEQLAAGLKLIAKASEIQYQYNKRKLVYQLDKVKLYHYQPLQKKPHAIPVLVVFATVNRMKFWIYFQNIHLSEACLMPAWMCICWIGVIRP